MSKRNKVAVEAAAPVVAQMELPEAKVTRIGVKPPQASKYTFDAGEQVCLVNLDHSGDKRFRSHYEYIRREGAYDYVKRTTDGAEKRVWLNKLMPMREALQLKKQVEAKEVA